MSYYKAKTFKKIFEANADDLASINGKIESVMTQETFVPLMGQMWDRAKNKYKKRYLKKTLEFAQWCMKLEEHHSDDSMEKLFEIWKKEN